MAFTLQRLGAAALLTFLIAGALLSTNPAHAQVTDEVLANQREIVYTEYREALQSQLRYILYTIIDRLEARV